MNAKLLLVNPEGLDLAKASPVLARLGYQVHQAPPGPDALAYIVLEQPDMVILGISQNNEKDWQFLHELAPVLKQPLLLLLTSEDRMDLIRGLDLGGDACMVYPFSLLELVARIRALLRRQDASAGAQSQDLFLDGDLFIDLTRREVRLDDEPVHLSPTEYRLLVHLVQHPDQIFSCERLLAEVWGPNPEASCDAVKQLIHHLRKKIEKQPRRPRHIVTVGRQGYCLQLIEGRKPELARFWTQP